MKEIKNWTKWIYWFTLGLALIFAYKTLDGFNSISMWFGKLFSILMPFILGILFAYLFYIPCRGIENLYKNEKFKFIKKHARGLSVFTVYLIALLLIVLLMNIVFPAISKSVVDLTNNLPTYYNKAIDTVNNLPEDSIISRDRVQEVIYNLQKVDVAQVLSMENITDYINKVIGFANTIFGAFVTIVMSVYILLQRDLIVEFINKVNRALFKDSVSEAIDKYFMKSNDILFKFIASQILDAIIVGTIVSIVMWIMGVKYGILLGFMIGLFNIIPYFGAIVGVGIAGIITLFTGGVVQTLWMLLVVIILQQIDANIINPKIVGNALKLSPILVIFSVTLFGAYFGVLGMFLAVPIIAITKILIGDYLDYKIRLKKRE